MFDLWPWGDVLSYALRKDLAINEPNMSTGLGIVLPQRRTSNHSTVFKIFLLPVLVVMALIFVFA